MVAKRGANRQSAYASRYKHISLTVSNIREKVRTVQISKHLKKRCDFLPTFEFKTLYMISNKKPTYFTGFCSFRLSKPHQTSEE